MCTIEGRWEQRKKRCTRIQLRQDAGQFVALERRGNSRSEPEYSRGATDGLHSSIG